VRSDHVAQGHGAAAEELAHTLGRARSPAARDRSEPPDEGIEVRGYVSAQARTLVCVEMAEYVEQTVVGSLAAPRTQGVVEGVVDVDLATKKAKDGGDEYPRARRQAQSRRARGSGPLIAVWRSRPLPGSRGAAAEEGEDVVLENGSQSGRRVESRRGRRVRSPRSTSLSSSGTGSINVVTSQL